eukprot:TRINITY_DN16972_c0_g1_i2.p1 TRINITY_DN16972_c0_g1~~TRINITY_DN16972_c0_g1_i2.p1  ORF type:complete len:209 (+),score=49.74 TRINITY_DN16972_c0_g1_i2:109-735(+)
MRGSNSARVDHRIQEALQKREEGLARYNEGDLISADEIFGEAVHLLERLGGPRGDQPRSVTGADHEEQLLADCFSNRAQCILDMAEGKGQLPDGTPFVSQFEEQEHFEYFKKQALKQAEEVAEKACLIWADDRSLYRLGLARMLSAQGAKVEAMWMMPEDNNEIMKDAGRCFLKSLKTKPSSGAQQRLDEVKRWLLERNVTSLYPEYI